MRQRSDYPVFSDAEIRRRHQVVYGLMEQEGVTALLFYGSGRYAEAMLSFYFGRSASYAFAGGTGQSATDLDEHGG